MDVTGWRRLLLALILGVVAALAQPPFALFPAIVIGYSGFVLLLDGVDRREASRRARCRTAFAIGWFFAFGYFLVGLYWIGEAFLVEAETYAWMIPFAVLLLPAGMALYWGLAAALAMLVWSPGWPRILALATILTAAEWLRGHFLTGFPWSLPGYIFGNSDAFSQSAALIGVYGLTFVILLLAGLPVLLLDKARSPGRPGGRSTWWPLTLGLVLMALMWGGGEYRLQHSSGEPEATAPRLRIVQPNIEQGEKWRPEHAPAIFNLFLELSMAQPPTNPDGLEAVDYLIWPESALPFLLEERADIRGVLGAVLPENVTLITGGLRREADPANPNALGNFYNSLQIVDHTGSVRASYDKWHLVPFGEYLPLESWLQPLGFRHLVALPSSFTAGTGPRTIGGPAGVRPFSPLICYEIIFPASVINGQGERPLWLLNVTNDAWFGQSAGPHQHFLQARFRAIEVGLPLVRAANTGISAIVDAQGRIRQSIGLVERGLIDARLPPPAPPTVYGTWGDLVLVLILLPALLLVLCCGMPRQRRIAGE